MNLCENQRYGCYHGGYHHSRHQHHWKYSTIAKKTADTVTIPEILLEAADIEEGDFFKIYVRKIWKNKK